MSVTCGGWEAFYNCIFNASCSRRALQSCVLEVEGKTFFSILFSETLELTQGGLDLDLWLWNTQSLRYSSSAAQPVWLCQCGSAGKQLYWGHGSARGFWLPSCAYWWLWASSGKDKSSPKKLEKKKNKLNLLDVNEVMYSLNSPFKVVILQKGRRHQIHCLVNSRILAPLDSVMQQRSSW